MDNGEVTKHLLENAPRVDVEKILLDTPAAPVAAEAPKQPAGTVERVLNFRDRNLLVGACREFCQKEGKGDHKAQSKLDKVMKLIVFQETLDYFEMIQDSVDDRTVDWNAAKNLWTAWINLQGGALTAEEFRKRFPKADVTAAPEKPARRQPEASKDDLRGKARSFYFTSKLDVWVVDCLKAAMWQPLAAEYVVELCAKFGIKDEE